MHGNGLSKLKAGRKGSTFYPTRPIENHTQNTRDITPLIAKLVNNGLPLLLTKFLKSRRQGISPDTLEFYEFCLKPFVKSYDLTPEGINRFLANLKCGNAKHAYFRAIRVFCNWAFREGYVKQNPIARVDPPKMTKVILPSLTSEQVDYLIAIADNVRDKTIISLFADSGIRLNELLNIKKDDIDLQSMTVTVWGKGGKQRKAPFTKRTAGLLRQLLRVNKVNRVSKNIWGLEHRGIQIILRSLSPPH